MKKYFLLFLAVITLIACKKDNDDEKTIELVEGYKYTFTVQVTGYWTKKTHPTDFPQNAHFGKILGITHKSDNLLFTVGEKAKDWMKPYFQANDTESFNSYFTDYKDGGKVGAIIIEEGFGASEKEGKEFKFTTTNNNSQLSLLMKLSPSPDWFVAISNVNLNPLATGGSVTYKVSSYDAGLFSGTTYKETGNSTDGAISFKNDAPLNYPKGGTNKFALVKISFSSREKM